MRAYKLCELAHLKSTLAQQRWRQALLLRGEESWCYEQLSYLRQDVNEPWYVLSNNSHVADSQWPSHLHQILGQEHSNAVYDCFSGFYADKLAALSGTVKAAGLLVLLMPEDTSCFIDPGIKKLVSYGHETPSSSHFWAWLETQLSTTQFTSVCQSKRLNPIPAHLHPETTPTITTAQQQQQAVITEIIDNAEMEPCQPLLISADRGRGKSAALGIAAARLAKKRIILCAIQRPAVASAFKHLALELGSFEANDNNNSLANLTYMPPDRLIKEQPVCDVLFVDEAATLPIHVLKRLLNMYPRIVFASTLIGYEGSGRGYTLRFKKYLDKHYPAHKESKLTQPFRFACNDPLEQGMNTLLALDAVSQDLVTTESEVYYRHIAVSTLIENPALLKQVFALLVLAHYQTSTNDFRQLLDAPGQQLYIVMQGTQLLGVALVMQEGLFDQQLAAQVAVGERRPQGHLLAQSLAQLAGNGYLAQLKCARVVRIAIHPNIHHQGYGQTLLGYIEKHQRSTGTDLIGTSFGAHARLLKFWQESGYNTVKLGFKRDHVSGEHSALMVKALSSEGLRSIAPIKELWQRDMTFVLAHFFCDISSRLKEQLLFEKLPTSTYRSCAQDDLNQLIRFVNSEIPLINTYGSLMRYLQEHPSAAEKLPPELQELLQQIQDNTCTQIKHKHSKKQFNLLLMQLVQFVITQR